MQDIFKSTFDVTLLH